MNVALLVIDMQKEFIENDICKESLCSALEYINETSNIFRKANMPVVIIQDEEAGDGPDSKGYELIDDLITNDSDIFISKFYSNAFWKTELDDVLKKENVDYVIVSGFAAEHCVLFTYNGALERGYDASILQHGIAGFDKMQVKETQYLRSTTSIESLNYFIK